MKIRPSQKYTQLELNFNQNANSIQKKDPTKNGTKPCSISRK